MNQIVPAPPQTGVAPLTPRDMTSAMALANMMCSAKLVPPHLQRSPGDCLLVIEQAIRWGMSPFAVAQCTSVIHGRLMFQGQLVSAALHTSGILSSRLSYEFKGQDNEREITISGTLKGEAEPRTISVKFKDARTDNAMWTKQPDQQLVYFATRAWARRHTPEVMLGVYAPEDFPAAAPATDNFQGTTIESAPDTGEAIGDGLPAHSAPPVKTPDDELLDRIVSALEAAPDAERVRKITTHHEAQHLRDRLRNGKLARLDAAIATAQARTAPEPEPAAIPPDGVLDRVAPSDAGEGRGTVENYEWPTGEQAAA